MGREKAGQPDSAPEGALEDRLRSARLTPAQRQVARFIVDHPDRFVFMSAAEVARDVGVSQPSVTRLAQELGYRGYAEMVGEMRALVRSAPRQYEPSANRYQRAIDDEIALLTAARERLADLRPLERAARKMMSASSVVVVGLRISAALAMNLGYRLARLRDNVRIVTQGGSVAFDEVALGARRESPVMVAFAMPRYPAELAEILRFARSRGYWILQVIDSPTAPLCEEADEVMFASIGWGATFGSHTTASVLSTLLIDAAASDSSSDARARLIELDAVASERSHYL
ncbi:transcriptional regulator [Streptosporangium violaceochromogenes]|nr:transcriptional regulator [Streptosporangium violaceochromogenes]